MIRVEEALAFKVHRMARLLRRHLAELTGRLASELTPEQWFVLNRLTHLGSANLIDLTDDAMADRPNITRIVASLERRRLVRRAADPSDGRKQLVCLTRLGREVHDRIADEVPRIRAELTRGISDRDLRTTERVLARMEQNLVPAD